MQIQKGSSYLALRQLKRKLKLMIMSGCGFAFDKGFCYRRIFITAGGFLLLITISQKTGAIWDSIQNVFDYPIHKTLQ